VEDELEKGEKSREGKRRRQTEKETKESRVRFGLAPATPALMPSDVGGPSLGAAIATVWQCHKSRFTSSKTRDRMAVTSDDLRADCVRMRVIRNRYRVRM